MTEEQYWKTKEGKSIAVTDMIDSHLRNAIAFIYRGGGYLGTVTEELAVAMYDELEKRGLKLRGITRGAFIDEARSREWNEQLYANAVIMELEGD